MFTQYTDSDLNCELKSCRTIQFNQKKDIVWVSRFFIYETVASI